jgi:membrane associated rhomboid family serine protease
LGFSRLKAQIALWPPAWKPSPTFNAHRLFSQTPPTQLRRTLQRITQQAHDAASSSSNLPVYAIIAANVLVFGQWQIARHRLQNGDASLWRQMNDTLSYRSLTTRVYTAVTAAFSHADPMHLFFNMFMLYQLGPIMLGTLGTGRFLQVYGLSAVSCSLISALSNRDSQPDKSYVY